MGEAALSQIAQCSIEQPARAAPAEATAITPENG
jgi:hypothetical protein